MTEITEKEFPGVHRLRKILDGKNLTSLPQLALQKTIHKDLPQAILDIAEAVHTLSDQEVDSKKFDALCNEIAQHIEEQESV